VKTSWKSNGGSPMSNPDLEVHSSSLTDSGLPPEVVARLSERFSRLTARHPSRAAGDAAAWFVPGRIEIVGKHTDYAGGRSLVCAVDRGLSVVATPRNDDRLVIEDIERASTATLRASDAEPPVRWALYPLTVLRRVARNFGEPVRGADIVFSSDLPSAAGMSSSSALMIAVLLVLAKTNGLAHRARWRDNIGDALDLASYAATIENGSGFRDLPGEHGVGTEGGSQDHTAILCCDAAQLTAFSYRPTRRERTIALPAELIFVIGVSGVRAQKTGGARDDYNRAARAAAAVLDRWRAQSGRQDDTLAAAVASAPDSVDQIRRALEDRPDLMDRFVQFVEESTSIVPSAVERLAAGDLDRFGSVVDRSQQLAEQQLRNQIPETIALARLARLHGALAASAFGAGFGGSVWALVEVRQAARFAEKWQNAYREAHPDAARHASFFATRPGPPAFSVRSS
jgi:galactokinase